jgi:tellurite resistance protein
MEPLDGKLGQAYAQALLAIARVDGEITPEEAARVRELVARRSPVQIDFEASFFDKQTPETLAEAVTRAGPAIVAPRDLGRALVSDAVALATADGDLNGAEAHAILRFARALGCTAEDVARETRQLDPWLSVLG